MGLGPVLVGGGLLLLAAANKRPSRPPVAIGQSLAGLVLDPSRPQERVSAAQAARGALLAQALSRTRLSGDQQLALMAMAWHESRFDPRAVGRGPDAAWGNSYTVLQFRRDVELTNGMRALGLRFDQVVPAPAENALDSYFYNQARLAEWLAGVKGIDAIWRQRGADDEKAVVDLALRWAGIRVPTWEGLLPNPIAGPVLNRFGGRLPTNTEIPEVNRQLAARGSQVMGVLSRLATYRVLRRAEVLSGLGATLARLRRAAAGTRRGWS